MERLEWTAHSLIDRIQSIIYSLDLSADQIFDTFRDSQSSKKEEHIDIHQKIEDLVDRFKIEDKNASFVNFVIDKNAQKLRLDVKFNPKKLVRPQDIVSDLFGITNPVYDMAREKIVFKSS